jgi:hypothetical protein
MGNLVISGETTKASPPPRTPSYTPAGGGAPYGSMTHGGAMELRPYLKKTCQ